MKLILNLICCFASGSAVSQTVFLPNIGTKWHYVYAYYSQFPSPQDNVVTEYTKDSVYNGDNIKILKVERIFAQCNILPIQRVFIKQRNDSIWFLNTITNNTWQLFINYNALAGQSWTATVLNYTIPVNYTITVNAVNTITINNLPLKTLKVTYKPGAAASYTSTIYERIGDIGFLFNFIHNKPFFACDADYLQSLLCYEDSTLGIKQFSSYDCNYSNPVGIHEKSLDTKIQIYPNPANDVIILKFDSDVGEFNKVIICNQLGQMVSEINYNSASAIINIKDLPEGVYTLKLTGSGSGNLNKRILIVR